MTNPAINDFLDLMPLSVSRRPFLSDNAYGQRTFGPEAGPYRARVNYEDHFIRGENGELVQAQGVIWLATDDRMYAKDLITLPDGSQPSLLKIGAETDETGAVLYTRIDFG